MTSLPISATAVPDCLHPGDLQTAWLIARRGAVESLRDQMTVIVSAFMALVIPFVIVLLAIRPQASQLGAEGGNSLGAAISTFLLIVGLLPSSGSIGIASGLFAGEKEHGILLPLLATPASNRAIFAGKVLGAVLPALLFAGIAQVSYLIEIWLLIGPSALRLLPLAFSCAMLALVPVQALLGAAIASLVSSRVRTYQSAQMLSGLALYPVMGALFGLAFNMQRWGPLALFSAILAIFALDVLLVVVSGATWRREEVLARH